MEEFNVYIVYVLFFSIYIFILCVLYIQCMYLYIELINLLEIKVYNESTS